MISVKSVVYGNAQAEQLAESDEADRPFAIQFFGRDPEIFAEAIRRMDHIPFDVVDINMGCPVHKIVKNGEGCALMNEPERVGQIVRASVRASGRPVTVKIRKGFFPGNVNAAEIARVAEASGAAAITVHGRTRDQFYSGSADYACIAEVKNAVKIPVIGNGDIFDAESAKRMFDLTGCDGVLVARGALGNPQIFGQILHFHETGDVLPPPGANERAETAIEHIEKIAAHKGERIGLLEMRKHLPFYVKNHPNAASIRKQINEAATKKELISIFKKFVIQPQK
jgi:nifR3 family TIM-barrel protein